MLVPYIGVPKAGSSAQEVLCPGIIKAAVRGDPAKAHGDRDLAEYSLPAISKK
jgi:hypothetical protein